MTKCYSRQRAVTPIVSTGYGAGSRAVAFARWAARRRWGLWPSASRRQSADHAVVTSVVFQINRAAAHAFDGAGVLEILAGAADQHNIGVGAEAVSFGIKIF